MRVSVSGQVNFPRQCICCGETADTQLHVSATHNERKKKRTQQWNIPCCSACLRHHQTIQQANSLPTFMFIFGGVLCLSGLYLFAVTPIAAFFVLLSGIFFLFYGYGQRSKRLPEARKSKKATCISDNPHVLIQYFGWDRTVHRFNIKSEPYAYAFIRANKQKLVGIPADILRLVNESSISPPSPVQKPVAPLKPRQVRVSSPTPVSVPQSPQIHMSSLAPTKSSVDVQERLQRLAELRDKGIITHDEYEKERIKTIGDV